MTERQLTSEFAKFLRTHRREDTECYEFKMIKSDSFNPKLVKQHQIDGLLKAGDGLWYKIQDSPFGGNNQRFTSQKPFDAVYIVSRRNYIVPIFYKERKYKEAILIPIKEFLKIKKSIKRSVLEGMGFEVYYL